MNRTALVTAAPNATQATGTNAGAIGRVGLILHWYDRARQQRRLKNLDARMLDDIGVSRTQARLDWLT